MESNDEEYDSAEESNSVSTDARNEKSSINNDKSTKRTSNVVFVSPNELENWDIDEPKSKVKKISKTKKSLPKQKSVKTPISVKSKKRRGRPKRKKDSNPWSSDLEDESLGLENEVSDDEYFRRLEEADNGDDNLTKILNKIPGDESEIDADLKEEDEYIFMEQIKTFDPDNNELLNFILNERENSLDIDDKIKPKIEFPKSSDDLKCPRDQLLQLSSIYETVIQYSTLLRISPFKIEDFISAMVLNENSSLLSELHMSVLKFLLREDESVNTSLCPLDQKDYVNFAFYLMDFMTWPEVLRLYIESLETAGSKARMTAAYPYVTLSERIDVLSFILDQFIYCNSVRNEIARENNLGSEDFCRICHLSGEVLCCDICTAVYHLSCLTPKLTEVPKTAWICSICVKHRIDGLFECNFDGDKALIEHKKTPLGNDRFGNTYWFIGRRLIVEPRNDNIEYILDYKHDSDYQPNYNNVLYYSSWNAVERLCSQLSKEWEEELCSVIDGLEDEMKKSMAVTLKLTQRGLDKLTKQPKVAEKNIIFTSVLMKEIEELDACVPEDELQEIEDHDTASSVNDEDVQNCLLKTQIGQPVGVIEDQEGLLVRSIDGNTIRVRLSGKTRVNQLDEVARRSNFISENLNFAKETVLFYRLSDEGSWRYYENFYTTEMEALSRNQHQEDKDKLKLLANKFGLTDENEFQWFISQDSNRAAWPKDSFPTKKYSTDVLGGPLNMLQCIRLTLQNIESQLFSSFMCPAWKSERKNFLINIQRIRNASSLADFVSTLQNAIRPCAFKKVWTTLLGFMKLERITVGDREEEKRVKLLEKKNIKTDADTIKTRNPGLLKHAIWKMKGEEYRRSGGDGWLWISSSISLCLNYFESQYDVTRNANENKWSRCTSLDIFVCEEIEELDLTENNDKTFLSRLKEEPELDIHSLLKAREDVQDQQKDVDIESLESSLSELKNAKQLILAKKKELDDRLGQVNKTYRTLQTKNMVSRKRGYYHMNAPMHDNQKRMRYDLNQYDGADDDTDSDSNNAQIEDKPVLQRFIQQQFPQTSTAVNSQTLSGMKPVLINSQNRICIVNMQQGGIQQQNAMNNNIGGNRFMINAGAPTSGNWNGNTPIIRLSQSQICRFVGNNNNIQKNFIQNVPTGQHQQIQQPQHVHNQSQQIRKIVPSVGQQVIMLNNLGNNAITLTNGQLNQSNNVIYNVNNQGNAIRLSNPVHVAVPGQQYKRLLPLDPSMAPQQQMRPQSNLQLAGMIQPQQLQQNMLHNPQQHQQMTQLRPQTPQMAQGRRSISKVNHNHDLVSRPSPALMPIVSADYQDEILQQRELDNITNQLAALIQQLEDNKINSRRLKFQIGNFKTTTVDEFQLYECEPTQMKMLMGQHNVTKLDSFDKDTTMLPLRHRFRWPDSDEVNNKVVKSVFLYDRKLLQPVIQAGGKTDVTGFEVEKKRVNSNNWPYPTARPNFSTTWAYRLSELIHASGPLSSLEQELAMTEDGEGASGSTVGASGLGAVALYVKLLWHSLRWDDMLERWQSGKPQTMPSGETGYFRMTAASGEVTERKLIGWRSLDDACSQCQFLAAVCVTSHISNQPTQHHNPSNSRNESESCVVTSGGRRSRRSAVARYADTDHFTDDGERDSDDSDPNFVPGMSVIRTPKTRGRRSRNAARGNEDGSGHSMAAQKQYSDVWMNEDDLELYEVRDFLLRTQWKKAFMVHEKALMSNVMRSLMSKQMFVRSDTMMVKPVQSGSVPSVGGPILPKPSSIMPTAASSQHQIAPAQAPVSAPVPLQPQPLAHQTVLGQALVPQPGEVIQSALVPSATTAAASKLIMESSSSAAATNQHLMSQLQSLQPSGPSPLTDIREVSRPVIEPPLSPAVIAAPALLVAPVAPGTSSCSTIQSRGRGRGRGRPPIRRTSESSHSEDRGSVGDDGQQRSEIKHMDVAVAEAAARVDVLQQGVTELACVRAHDRTDQIRADQAAAQATQAAVAEQAKKQRHLGAKKRSHAKKTSHSDDDEETDAEIETPSTSPADTSAISNKKIKREYEESPPPPEAQDDEDSEQVEDEEDNSCENIQPQSPAARPPLVIQDSRRDLKRSRQQLSRPQNQKSQSPSRKKIHIQESKNDKNKPPSRETERLYCICKTPNDSNADYICCDYCDNWFHFKCVGVDDSYAKSIKKYKCVECQKKKESVKSTKPVKPVKSIVKIEEEEDGESDEDQIYCLCREKYDKAKMYIACDFCDEWYHPKCVHMTDDEANNYSGDYKCPRCVGAKGALIRNQNVNVDSVDCERRIDSNLKKKLVALVNKIMLHSDALPFFKDFKPDDYPKYYQVVKNPMDLLTAKANLEKSKYKNVGSFKLDVQRIFVSCTAFFDGSSKELKSAKKLEAYFLSQLKFIC